MAKQSPLNINSKLFESLTDAQGRPVMQGSVSRELINYLNQFEALKVQVGADQLGIHVQTDGTVRIGDGVTNYINIGTDGLVGAATSLWWDAKSVDASSASPGASGAVWVAPDANTLGGYRLSAAAHKIYFNESITSMWDGVSDLQFRVVWEVNEVAAADGDVDLKLICYYKGNHETVNKTQTLTESHTVTGDKAQYTRHSTVFTIDWDVVANIVEVGDKMSFILSCEATGDVTDIIANTIMFRNKTAKINVEV